MKNLLQEEEIKKEGRKQPISPSLCSLQDSQSKPSHLTAISSVEPVPLQAGEFTSPVPPAPAKR